jgi:hypothetical protein
MFIELIKEFMFGLVLAVLIDMIILFPKEVI